MVTICLALAMAMVIIDMTVANVALPTIAGELGVPPDLTVWVITSYVVAEAISLALSHYVSNFFGRGRTLVYAITGFCLFSFACGIATGLETLIVYRIAQAFCGGQIIPAAQSLIVDLHDKAEYGRAIAVVSSIGSLAPIVGPIVGGWLTETWSWRFVFLVNIPLAIGVLALIGRWLWPLSVKGPILPIDRWGIVLLILFVACIQIFLDLGHKMEWLASPWMVALLAGSIIFLGLFIIWELWDPFPVLNIRILQSREYGLYTAVFTSMFACYFAGLVITTLWLQEAMNYTPISAGLATAGAGGIGILILPVVVKLSAMLDQRFLVTFGCLVSAFSFTLRVGWSSDLDFDRVVAAHVILGLATPFYSVPLTAIILGSVKENERTLASGLLYFLRTLGAGMFTAGLTAFWINQAYRARTQMVQRINIDMFSTALPDLSANERLSALDQIVARESMTVGFNQVSFLCASVFALSALCIWLVPKPRF
jgi:MFS transporter, DHA2 family, multidrug resistance protein